MMRLFKRLITTAFVMLITFTMLVPVSARNSVEKISFITPEHNLMIVTEYDSNLFWLETVNYEGTTTFTVKDFDGNEIESWIFEPQATQRMGINSISTYRHLNRKNIGAFSGVLVNEKAFELYSEGSFRQFNEELYDIQYIEGWSYFNLEAFASSVRPTVPSSSWPAVRVKVSYTATVGVTLDVTGNVQYGPDLLNAGFYLAGGLHYIKRVTSDYEIIAM